MRLEQIINHREGHKQAGAKPRLPRRIDPNDDQGAVGPQLFADRRVALTTVAFMLAAFLLHAPARAQSATAPQAASPAPTAVLLEPTLSELRSTILMLHIAKWKAPGPVKDEAQGNVGSIDRDLENTLPGLVAQADATPQSVANHFAVYRNLDALYEVLLRVSGTAELAAPDEEAADVAHSLLTLDAARRALADSIATTSRAQEEALRRPTSPPPPVAQPTPAATTVIDDGPAAAPAHRKPKPKPKPKTIQSPAPQPQTTQP